MLAIFALLLTMVGLIIWAIPMAILSQGDAGVGPLSVTLDETTYNRRYKLCKTWIIIGSVCILSGIALIYAYC